MLSDKKWEPLQVLMLGVLVFLSLTGGVLAAAIVSQVAKSALNPNSAALVTLVITVLGFHGMALVWVHFFLLKHELTWSEAFGFSVMTAGRCVLAAAVSLPAVLGVVFLLSMGSEWALRQLHEQVQWSWLKPEPQAAVQLLQQQWPAHLIALQGVVAIVLAPISEEVLFRGILYTALKQRGHPFVAIWLPALLFAAIHFYPVGFLALIFLSVALVALYEWTRSLLAPILLHSMFNAVNFALIVAQPEWEWLQKLSNT